MPDQEQKRPEFLIRSKNPRLRQTGMWAFPSMMTSEVDPATGITRIEVHHQIFPGTASPEDIERFKFEVNMRAQAMLRGKPEGSIDPETPPSQGTARPEYKP